MCFIYVKWSSHAQNGRAVAVVVVVVFAHNRPFLLLPDRHRHVAEQGLRPDMAIRAYNNPTITGPALSRAISRLVNEHDNAAVERLLQNRKVDAAGGGPSDRVKGEQGKWGGGMGASGCVATMRTSLARCRHTQQIHRLLTGPSPPVGASRLPI